MLSFKQFITLFEEQEYTSEDTSRNQISAGIKFALEHGLIKSGDIAVDHGGGKYDKGILAAKKHANADLFVHDPFNRSEEHNTAVKEKTLGRANYTGLHNVLNVIKEPEERRKALENMKSFMSPTGIGHITVYEGSTKDKQSGSKETKDGWQEFRSTSSYLPEIRSVFPSETHDVIKKGKHIIIKPKGMNLNIQKIREVPKERKIGKDIGGELYLHKNYESELPDQESLIKAKNLLPKEHLNKYNVVKYNKKNGTYSFIHSPDFDVADEPISGDSYKVHPTGEVSFTKQKSDPQIWHHKHEWVGDDYTGFDVEKSKARSAAYKPILNNIRDTTDSKIYKRIGTKSFWDREIVPHIK